MKKHAISLIVLAGSLSLSHAAAIFVPGDTIVGGRSDGTNFVTGSAGFGFNQWPSGEVPGFVIDGVGQKYLNFGKEDTGVIVTPSAGSSIATSITLWSANDAPERDPASYSVYGTNSTILGAGPNAVADFTLISSGPLALPLTRNLGGANPLLPENSQTVAFANTNAFTSYMVVFPTLRDSGAANSMQIAEIQLNSIPEPSTGLLSLLAATALLGRRRR